MYLTERKKNDRIVSKTCIFYGRTYRKIENNMIFLSIFDIIYKRNRLYLSCGFKKKKSELKIIECYMQKLIIIMIFINQFFFYINFQILSCRRNLSSLIELKKSVFRNNELLITILNNKQKCV